MISRRLRFISVAGCSVLVVGLAATPADAAAKPKVSALSVAGGPTSGGTRVSITGSGFSAVTAVDFGKTHGRSVKVVRSTLIRVTAPEHTAGRVDVRVVTRHDGTSAVNAKDRFTFAAAPQVRGVSPESAPAGVDVTVTGRNFEGVTAVTFGKAKAASVDVLSARKLTATVPEHALGPADVRVTAFGGRSAVAASDRFTYVAAPTFAVSAAPLPGNATSTTDGFITGSDCPVVGWCAAVGTYTDTGSHDRGFLDVYDDGTWTTTQTPVPDPDSSDDIYGVSCWAKQGCVAVGDYVTSTGTGGTAIEPMSVQLSTAGWTATAVPGTNINALRAIACPAADECAALAYNAVGVDDSELYLRKFGTWSEQAITPPTGSNVNVPPTLQAIGCDTDGSCAAVGEWTDSANQSFPLVESLTGSGWHQSTGAVPSGTSNGGLYALACTSSCVAGGGAQRGSGSSAQDVVFDGAVGSAATSVVPGPAASNFAPRALACSTPTDCVLAAFFHTSATSKRTRTVLAHQTGTTWATQAAPLPAHAGGFSAAGAACPAAGQCAIAGQWYSTSVPERFGLEVQYGDSWYPAVVPAGQLASSDTITGLSCPSAGNCVAATELGLIVES